MNDAPATFPIYYGPVATDGNMTGQVFVIPQLIAILNPTTQRRGDSRIALIIRLASYPYGACRGTSIMIKKINHIGIAVPNIDESTGLWADVLGLTVTKRETVEDQGVNVAFLPIGESKVELIEPLDEGNGIGRFLQKRGPGIHHICFEVDDIDQALADLKAADVPLIDEVARPASGGKRLAFLHPKGTGGVLIELYELPNQMKPEA